MVAFCVKSMTAPVRRVPVIIPMFKQVFKIPYPRPILARSRISIGKARIEGTENAPTKPRRAVRRKRVKSEENGSKKSKTVIPKAEKMIRILRLPSLSEMYPVRGAISDPIISILARKLAREEASIQKSSKSLGPHVVKEIIAMLKVAQARPRSQICLFPKLRENLLDLFSFKIGFFLALAIHMNKTAILMPSEIRMLSLQLYILPRAPRRLNEKTVAKGMLSPKIPIANPLSFCEKHCEIKAIAETPVTAPPTPSTNLPTPITTNKAG